MSELLDHFEDDLGSIATQIQLVATLKRFRERDQIVVTPETMAQLKDETIYSDFMNEVIPIYVEIGSTDWNNMLEKYDFRSRFSQYVAPSPSDYDPMIAAMHTTRDEVENGVSIVDGTVVSIMRDAWQDLSDWEGDAASTFKADYLSPFPEYHGARLDLIGELHNVAMIQRAIVEGVRSDVHTIAHTTLNTLLGLDPLSIFTAEKKLALVAGFAGVAGAIVAAPGTAIAATAAVPFALTNAIASATAAVGGSSDVGGTSVDEIIASMIAMLDSVDSGVQEATDAVVGFVDKDLQDVLPGGGDTVGGYDIRIVGPQPSILDLEAEGYDEFEPPTRYGL